jgi:hypothetical protein
MKHGILLIIAMISMTALARDSVESVEPDPLGGGNPVATNSPASVPAKETPVPDPMGGATVPTSDTTTNKSQEAVSESSTPPDPMGGTAQDSGSKSSTEKKALTPPKPPLTPEIANLNLPSEVEVPNEDPDKVLYLPAGTYRQILQIPIDSPTMQSANQTRVQRGQEVKAAPVLPPKPAPNSKPLWIRYESLEKIKIGGEERRGGIDLPVNGPSDLKPRLWYAKSESADTWSSLFYFVFGGAGYTVANLAGWSAGNVREIPVDFPYRLVRK